MFSRFTNWPMTALLRRELLRNLRTARPFLALLATALFCSLIVLAFWPSDNTPMQQVGMASATIIRGLALLLLAAVALFVPAFGATSIVLEHQERTYDQLRLTLISTWGVLLGKYFSAVGFFIILLICCAPILATLFFLTGLDWLTLAGSLLILLVTALSCGAVSVFSSVTIRRLPLAVMRAYLLTLCVLGLPSYVIFILAVVFGWQPSSAWAISLMTITSPFVSLVTLRMGLMNSGPLLLAALYHVVLAGVVLTLAWAILRRPRNPELPEDPNARPRGFAGWSRRIAKGVVPKHGPIPDWANPVYAREIRHAPSARRAYRRRAFLFSLIACASLAATLWGIERQRGGGYGDDLLVMYVGALMAIAGLASPGVVANALAKEREQDTLDLLRLTPMSPMRVVFGKTLAGLATMRARAGRGHHCFARPGARHSRGPRRHALCRDGFRLGRGLWFCRHIPRHSGVGLRQTQPDRHGPCLFLHGLGQLSDVRHRHARRRVAGGDLRHPRGRARPRRRAVFPLAVAHDGLF